MSSLYPVSVTQAYGISEVEDWTSPTIGGSQSLSRSSLKHVREHFPKYDGYGLPISGSVNTMLTQVARKKSIPDSIYLYWVSLANQRFFVTRFDITPEIVAKMQQLRHWGNRELHCSLNQFVFGLLPNGQAKVWLTGCRVPEYIGEVAPLMEGKTDSNGFDKAYYQRKYYTQEIKDRAKALGVDLFPVPWDRLERVYTYDKDGEYALRKARKLKQQAGK
ncbi:hypothetical protein VA7868_00070 [Vibrio aerogenes CECT 7868]|uniref:DUF2931 family protein n=1 Tax=Vibrio aerogenes CECT 7868 TaxID=1216006 RepID=A0A1M5UDT9_9VIBR|nr:DUF2931 family protein [Vibrio aerogenes]SHH61117.1 hypothetical protein VA7868_00070 [Vibrio aerogenes CECT 7868]